MHMIRLQTQKYNVHDLPKTIRRQFAPGPGMIEPAFPSRTKLVRVRVDRACLWSVCKTSSLAMFLIVIGATMAVVGFYAPELSSHEISVGNTTYTTVNANAHWHLKNLTFVGPAFMGLGSVIIVAICVMTFEARDKAAKICPEDPPKKLKDELCVNVLKNLVRKYSGVPKIAPQMQEDQEASRLIPIYSTKKQQSKRSSQFLETPTAGDYALGTRCSSEPCFALTSPHRVNLNMQLPAVHVTSADSPSPPPPQALTIDSSRGSASMRSSTTGCSSTQPEANSVSSKTSSTAPVVAQQEQTRQTGTASTMVLVEEPPRLNIAQHTSGSSSSSASAATTTTTAGVLVDVRRQSTVSRETVVDIHPLPASCSNNSTSHRNETSCPIDSLENIV